MCNSDDKQQTLEKRYDEAEIEYYAELEKAQKQLEVLLEMPKNYLKDPYDAYKHLKTGMYLMTQELYDWTMEVIGEDSEGYMQSDSIEKVVYYDGEFFCGYSTIEDYLQKLNTFETYHRQGYYDDEAPRWEAVLNLMS